MDPVHRGSHELERGLQLVTVGCLTAYGHFRAEGGSSAALVCLTRAAVLAFSPVRHVVGAALGIGRRVMRWICGWEGQVLWPCR